MRPLFKTTVHERDPPSAIPKVRDLFIVAFPGFDDPFRSPQLWPDFRDSFTERQTENNFVEIALRAHATLWESFDLFPGQSRTFEFKIPVAVVERLVLPFDNSVGRPPEFTEHPLHGSPM